MIVKITGVTLKGFHMVTTLNSAGDYSLSCWMQLAQIYKAIAIMEVTGQYRIVFNSGGISAPFTDLHEIKSKGVITLL